MRRTLAIAIVLAALAPVRAGAARIQTCGIAPDEAAAECYDEVTITISGEGSEEANSDLGGPSLVQTQYGSYRMIVAYGGPDLSMCTEVRYEVVRSGESQADVTARREAGLEEVLAGLPSCPFESGPSVPSDTTPQTYAIQFWQRTPLPEPEPYIAPGRAITGMFAYLETRGTTAHTYTEENTPFGPLTVVATGKYYVDWGDGTKTGPHSAEGGPWPDGQIKHEYIHIGAYDVVVTERWTAIWSFGDRSGTLNELRTVGRIDDFPVQQIQAVVLR